MDWYTVLTQVGALLPAVAKIVPDVTLAVTAASAVTMAIPAPKSGPLAKVWTVLNWFAMNFANAKNAAATDGVHRG
jgi:hypothetical protein